MSLLFHCTLWWIFQKLDEVWENGILIYMAYWQSDGRATLLRPTLHFLVCSALILAVRNVNFCELHLVTIVVFTLAKFRRVARCNAAVGRYVLLAGIFASL
eukprot:4819746-Amphidinium_carterae.1